MITIIILKEDDKIITDERDIYNILNDFFSHVAMDIGFKDDIPDDFQTADGFAKIIDKHANHPSVIKIKENIQTQQYFYFPAVNDKYIEKIMQRMDPKRPRATTIYLANCYVLGPLVFLLMYPK